ncbi:mechanosensitive ion channel domain-containing protein [Acidicapsa acidisoli]|uniref:mechanosensitive ion channel domain-containing protein n=1 Tax=Acidicapsa acidisoli TaxID=1615681 RepID=UPI0021E0BC6F|nr:mechanosensitive ion channel domain-containing protein [Acidicapsa acidisoli]
MEHLPFLKGQTGVNLTTGETNTLVDLRPWQTIEALAPLAVTSEENEYAHQAERLADHEVDQAFASALRLATVRVQGRVLSGDALALSQEVAQLQQLVQDDQAQVKSLSGVSGNSSVSTNSGDQGSSNGGDLEIAKAQLGLDSDQLADAQQDLARASGDDRAQIQSELTEHEASMKKYDSESRGDTQVAVVSAARFGTLASRIRAWNSQRARYRLILQALLQAQNDVKSLTVEHNALESQANTLAVAPAAAQDRATRLASIRQRSVQRQLLSLYDDRIQTQQQLAAVYEKWAAQVLLQHRIVMHLMLGSMALIAFVLISVIVGDALVVRLMARPGLDRRRMQTLRTILQLGIQFVGILAVLLVVFGSPEQMPTILGLATAGFTVVMQDFIIAFFGWFVLMGKHGIRVGDWVEINGVGGEVTEIGLFRTTMLETGNWTDKGHPTGRRVTFINSFAIRGQYFNFSTTGQWMWDEISVSVPASDDAYAMVDSIHAVVQRETEKDARVAEGEWKRGTRQDGLSQFTADPTVSLRPSGAGIDILVRYVTRASDRFEMRNRLCQKVIDVLHPPNVAAEAENVSPS